ncbi:MAG: response regulator [Planctomycetes bacterium]|nr:response regulator [Planctomycetota bacterium]
MFDILGLRKQTNKTKILIVDDEPNIVQTLKDRLEANDYEVLTASNGSEGLQMALDERPDVVLLDIIMPVMDGHEMLEALRKDSGGQYISVIMLTAKNQIEDVERANASGIDDYIVKPFDMSDLLEKIELIVENNKSLAE